MVNVPQLRMGDAGDGERPDAGPDRGVRCAGLEADQGARPAIQTWRKRRLWPRAQGLNLEAFEQYIRGITEPDQAERLEHLDQAVKLSPDFSPAWMALAREDYTGQQYEQAAAAFAKVKGNDARMRWRRGSTAGCR